MNFNPGQGYEQKNKRPAIALSHDLVAKTSNMTIVTPISSTKQNFPMYYSLKETKDIHGKNLLNQIIALDLKTRNITAENVVEKYQNKN